MSQVVASSASVASSMRRARGTPGGRLGTVRFETEKSPKGGGLTVSVFSNRVLGDYPLGLVDF